MSKIAWSVLFLLVVSFIGCTGGGSKGFNDYYCLNGAGYRGVPSTRAGCGVEEPAGRYKEPEIGFFLEPGEVKESGGSEGGKGNFGDSRGSDDNSGGL